MMHPSQNHDKFADKVIAYNRTLQFRGELPKGFQVMNPFQENPEILPISETFYKKYYNDSENRKLILGINPGRLGAGATGIPFTDSKRLKAVCGIDLTSVQTHEPSSVFVYDLIEKYGGAQRFYQDFYISSVFPLGFLTQNTKGNWVNANYYDQKELFEAVKEYIIKHLKQQIELGIRQDAVYVLGKKNAQFLQKIQKENLLFEKIITVEHPRYIEQYKTKEREKYLEEFLVKLS
ncbi:MAG: SMUG2 DNA glycosylase family protein [Microscillaceae bacterium]|nr:SMUG2 DNA glycosylase family protein [Microscillaceae bacterium]